MALPKHRRTRSDKRRRAAHFALKEPTLTKDKKTGAVHRPHRAAPGATEYRGIKIHVKGHARKLEKMLAKTKSKTVEEEAKKPEAKEEKKPAAKKKDTKAKKPAAKKTKTDKAENSK